jgi:hypothetical protein
MQLNTEVVLVRDPCQIVELATNLRMTVSTFVNELYRPRTYTDYSKEKPTLHRTAKEWIEWPARNEVKRITYRPGAPRITEEEELNTWIGWGCEPKQGDITPWSELLDHLFGEEKAALEWFRKWLAYPLRYPGTKLYSAVVLWGRVHGTGKSLIGYSMSRIYGTNATEIGERELHSLHNEWAENKQFVMADEIVSGGEQKRRTADHMKSMITQQQLLINRKYIPTYAIPDCINYYFTSNHADCFYLEDEDRRLMIHEVTAQVKPSEFYTNYVEWLNKGGSSALFYHLLHLDLTGFNPAGHALQTRAKQEMTELGRSDVADWVAGLRDNPEPLLTWYGKTIPGGLFSTDELYRIFCRTRDGRQLTRNGLSRALTAGGFRKVNKGYVVQGCKGQQSYGRLWAIRNQETVLKLSQSELHKQYTKEVAERRHNYEAP